MKVVSADTETHLIKPGMPAPKLVCWTEDDGSILLRDEAIERARELLSGDTILTGANFIGFDLIVLCAEDETLIPLVFKALDEGRVQCVLLRQMLIDNANGELKYVENELGEMKKQNFSLQNLVLRHLGKFMPKGQETWRLRYNELDGVPLSEWPKDALDYAIGDSVDNRGVYDSQESLVAPEGIPGEIYQAKAAWFLALMSTWGVRTDRKGVEELKRLLGDDYKEQAIIAKKHGYIRESGTRDMKKIKDAVVASCKRLGIKVKLTKGKQVSTERDVLKNSGDDGLKAVSECVRIGKVLSTYVPALELGITVPINCRYNAILETIRTSCGKPNLQNPPRSGGVRECFVARPGFVFMFADYDRIEMLTLAQVCLDLFGYSCIAEAAHAGQDFHLSMAADILKITYEEAERRYEDGDEEIGGENGVRQYCFHPDTEALTPSGWKKIADLELSDTVAAGIPEDGSIRLEWQKPTALSRRPADELVHLRCEGIDLRVTKDHRMLAIKASDGSPEVTTPLELSKKRGWWNTGIASGGSWDPDEKLLRLAVATQADGSYQEQRVYFGFSKQRKIDRLRQLLEGFEYDERPESRGNTRFVLDKGLGRGKRGSTDLSEAVKALLSKDKQFDDRWLNLSQRGRQIVIDEARYWDATSTGRMVSYTYFSMNKRNTDILQIIATLEGRKTRLVQDKTTGIWNLTVRDHSTRKNDRSRGDNLVAEVIPHDGDVVCLSVPSSFVLVRDGGVPCITGQCKIANYGFAGGMSWRTFVEYAKGYGITITPEDAQRLHKGFREKWREMNDYFRFCGSLVGRGEDAQHVTFVRSGMVRGRVRYTAICNGFFQHLAAMGAKEAGYEVARECYTGFTAAGEPSALYGCRPWLFAHDEIGAENPYTGQRASDAAYRLQTIMEEVMQRWCPDVPIKASSVMHRRWYKGGKPKIVNGILLPSKPEKYINAEGKKKTRWVHDAVDSRLA